MIYKILISIILTEAITELVVKSRIFQPVRDRIDWYVLKCGYCFAMWAAIPAVLIMGITLGLPVVIDQVFAITLIHRCASHLHDLTHIIVRHGEGKI